MLPTDVPLAPVLLVILSLVAAMATFGGDAWRKGHASLIGRVTVRGWVLLGCLLLTAAVGVVKELDDAREANVKDRQMQHLRDDASGARSAASAAQGDAAAARAQTVAANAALTVANRKLDSERSLIDATGKTLSSEDEVLQIAQESLKTQSDENFIGLLAGTRKLSLFRIDIVQKGARFAPSDVFLRDMLPSTQMPAPEFMEASLDLFTQIGGDGGHLYITQSGTGLSDSTFVGNTQQTVEYLNESGDKSSYYSMDDDLSLLRTMRSSKQTGDPAVAYIILKRRYPVAYLYLPGAAHFQTSAQLDAFVASHPSLKDRLEYDYAGAPDFALFLRHGSTDAACRQALSDLRRADRKLTVSFELNGDPAYTIADDLQVRASDTPEVCLEFIPSGHPRLEISGGAAAPAWFMSSK